MKKRTVEKTATKDANPVYNNRVEWANQDLAAPTQVTDQSAASPAYFPSDEYLNGAQFLGSIPEDAKKATYEQNRNTDKQCECDRSGQCDCSADADKQTKGCEGQDCRNEKFDAVEDNDDKINTLTALTAVYENAIMAKESTDALIEHAEKEFGEVLQKQVLRYDEFLRRAQAQANTLNETLDDKTKASRTMAKMGMKLKLVADRSTTALAKMIMLGATNGVIDLGRIIRHTPNVSKEAGDLARELLSYEEEITDEMKYYL